MRMHFLIALFCTAVMAPAARSQQTVVQRLDTIEAKIDKLADNVAKLAESRVKAVGVPVCPVLGKEVCPGSCDCQKTNVCSCLPSQPAVLPKTVVKKTCPCSKQCTCGCNETGVCECNRLPVEHFGYYRRPEQTGPPVYLWNQDQLVPSFGPGVTGGACRGGS